MIKGKRFFVGYYNEEGEPIGKIVPFFLADEDCKENKEKVYAAFLERAFSKLDKQ